MKPGSWVAVDSIDDALARAELLDAMTNMETFGPLEKDPTGRKPTDAGAKLDSGKPMPDLILDAMSRAIMEVAKVATMGALKYSENGWESVPDGIKRYRRAGDRHRLYRCNETYDPESSLLHLAHEAWNRLAELELTLRENTNATKCISTTHTGNSDLSKRAGNNLSCAGPC